MIKTFSMTALALMVSASAFAGSTRLNQTTSEYFAKAANVDVVENIKNVDGFIKIYSMSGGDPAMNGSYVNLAVYLSAQDGYAVYELGNVYNWKLLKSAKHGYAKVALVKDVMDDNGNIVKQNSTLFLNLTKAQQGIVEIEEVKAK
jgi:hypothetical protein